MLEPVLCPVSPEMVKLLQRPGGCETKVPVRMWLDADNVIVIQELHDRYTQVGMDYCVVHHGTRNEDDPRVDDGDRLTCEWYDDHEGDEDGNPIPCDLRPLLIDGCPSPTATNEGPTATEANS
jgi:hypothetical protein